MNVDKSLLIEALLELDNARQKINELSYNEPIAVIGLSCRFPGGADNPDAFWQLLHEGFDASIEVPKTRWNIDEYYDPNPDTPGKMISRKSSFITSPIDEFDASLFGISPREAEYLDPQQRLLLETTWEALEDARFNPLELKGSQTGVFIGICGSDYATLLLQHLSDSEIDAYFGTGNAASTASGRLSYTFGLQGPNFAIDTACSSSLVALHEACQSLRHGECDLAIAGGVNVLLAPQMSIDFSQAHMLAPDGYCKTFDKSADGYVRGEGCGIIILKRLSAAVRDGDKILAVIKGSAINQDGSSGGLTIPYGPAQEAVIKRALTQAQLKPDDIDYIEAHGTGTALGDPIEINAIYHVFGVNQEENKRTKDLIISTVKTNVGHLEGAAGIVGVIKTILSLQHEEIPKHLHFSEKNPQIIDFGQIPAQIPLQPITWKRNESHIRRAGISSFGFSGTNAHVILEEAPVQDMAQIREAVSKTPFNRQRYWAKGLDEKKQKKPYAWKKTLPVISERDIATPNLLWVIISDANGVSENLKEILIKHGVKTQVFTCTVPWRHIKNEISQQACGGLIYFNSPEQNIGYENLMEVNIPLWIIFSQVNTVEEGDVDAESLHLENIVHEAFFSADSQVSLIGIPQGLSAEKQIAKAIYFELCQKQPMRFVIIGHIRYILETNFITPQTAIEKQTLITLPEDLHTFILEQVREKVLNVLGMPLTSTQDEKGFFELGMDSLMAVELNKDIRKVFPSVTLSSTATFDNPTISKLVTFIESELIGVKPKVLNNVTNVIAPNESIAIIGMSCRFPGGANSPEAFWQLLEQGYDGGIEIPKTRWDIDDYPDMYAHRAAFMNMPIDEFAAEFFNISPREAEYMDPQQRILLEETSSALEDARIAPFSLKESNTGVFIGICSHDYLDLLGHSFGEKLNEGYVTTGNTASIAAGRISYSYDFKGPSVSVDTACSSSVVSVHLACQSLREGECDLALAGGVNVILSPICMESLCQLHMLSPEGYCKTLDKNADGFLRGEGCGIIVLKRLSDAQRDNDRILAIVKGSAMNQDGTTSGLTVPNGTAQEVVIRKALQQAQLNPEDIDYIELHGTGTSLGDPIEVNALGQVFNGHQRPLILGTVKTNVGHLEGAAGIVGIIKTILALQHEIIPKHLHFHELNPAINLETIPAQIPLEPIAWKKQSGHIRYAGVSSFGFSGTNAHLILQEAPEQDESLLRQVLPKTQFQRERYWIDIKKPSLFIPSTASAHPFLGSRLESPALKSVVYESYISLQNTPLLGDHVFYGVPILAFAAYLSTLIEAVGQVKATSMLILENLIVETPLLFKENEVRIMQTICKTESFDEETIPVAITSRRQDVVGDWVENFTGRVTFRPQVLSNTLDLDLFKQTAQKEIAGETMYAEAANAGVILGPGFRWVHRCYIGDNYILAQLVPPPVDYLGEAIRPAGYLDVGFMLAASRYLQEGITPKLYVPVLVEDVQIARQKALGNWVYVKFLEKKEEEKRECEVSWVDNEGRFVDSIKSVQFRYAPKERLLQTLESKKTIDELLQLLVWKEVHLEVTDPSTEKDIIHYECSAEINNGELNKTLLDLVVKLQKVIEKPTRIYVITHNAEIFDGHPINLAQSPIRALLETAQIENPLLECVHVDCLEPCEEQVQRVMALGKPESMYVLNSHQVYVGRLINRKMLVSLDKSWIVPTEKPMQIVAGAYLITGGLGDLGLLVAQWLVQQGASRVWLVSRHASPDHVTEVQRLLGEKAQIVEADMSVKEAVEEVISRIQKDEMKLVGIFHLAGVIDDSILSEQTPERLQKVWSSKARSAWNLHELTQDLNLSVFVMFSSATSMLGSAGQANYAMANAYLDALAHYRRQKGLVALSIDWGPWQIGMAKDLQSRMQQLGMKSFSSAQGMWIMEEVLKIGFTQTVALDMNWSHFAKARLVVPAWLKEMATGSLEAKGELVILLEQSPDAQRFSILQDYLVQLLKRTLGIAEQKDIALDQGFFNLGMDSLMAMDFRNQVQAVLGSDYPLSAAEIFNYPDIEKLSFYIADQLGLEGLKQPKIQSKVLREKVVQTDNEPIAVIGMSCRFPGGANSPEEFWNLLAQGYDGISDVPASRWDKDAYYDADPNAPGKMRVKKGGFLDWPIAEFDADYFRINPRQAEMMDPQQRLLLELSVEAIEDAGIPSSSLKGSQTGVFVAIWHSDYGDLLAKYGSTQGVNMFTNSSSLSAAPGLIAFEFGLMGPAYAVDTACSSSLVALEGAMNALHRGECDLALVGASNLMLNPDITIGFDKAGMLSPDGFSKSFDESGDGYGRGEGMGVIILKRLSEAQKDNDQIYGVIKSTRVNHNGPASAITVPNGVAQTQLIQNALEEAKVKPEDIDYIEAHGTGTSLGDPIEVSAIQAVFRGHRQAEPLLIGSVKSNIGHLETAAGLAGLIKVLLALQHEAIPPNIHFTHPNSMMDLNAIPAVVPVTMTPWQKNANKKRLAGISSFGATGINAHLIVEEAPMREEIIIPPEIQEQLNKKEHLLVISAKTDAALEAQIQHYIGFLQTSADSIYDICYSSQVARNHFEKRISVFGKNLEELIVHLKNKDYATDIDKSNYIYTDEIKPYLKKVQLPKYAFQRERYWSEILTRKITGTALGKEVHPLLGIQLPTSAAHNELTFMQMLSIADSKFSYLSEHQVFDHVIFPGSGYVELMLAALRIKTNHVNVLYGIELSQVSLELPLPLIAENKIELQTIVSFTNSDTVKFSIYSRRSDADIDFSSWQLHAHGEGRRSEQLSLLNAESLEKIKAECPEQVDSKLFYKTLMQQGLQYGSAFQTLKQIFKGEKSVLAKIAVEDGSNTGYILYPPLLDGALQALSFVMMTNETGAQVYLPIGFDSIIIYRDVPSSFYIYATKDPSITTLVEQDIMTVDFMLLDEKGVILAKILGFKGKRTTRRIVEKLISNKESVANWCYVSQWLPYTLVTDKSTMESAEIKTEIPVIYYDARTRLENNVNLQVVEALVAFLQAQIINNTNNTPVVIITEQAYSLSGEAINLNQGMLNGLIKTAILEHPELRIRQLDVSGGAAIEPLLLSLGKDISNESLFAYRNQEWYVQRVLKSEQADKEEQRISIPAGPYRLVKSQSGIIDELNLVEEEVELVPKDDEVVIAPYAVGLNFRDVLNVMNLYPGDPGPLGGDCAGVVKAVGKNVSDFAVDDEVLGLALGSLASQALTRRALIVKKPTFLTFSQAAAIPTVFITAYYGLVMLAKLQAGETVLIHAGAGGVGLAAIQIAKYLKANIIATAGNAEKRKYLQSLGVQHVFDSRSLSYQPDILRVTEGLGVDVVLNSLTGPGFIEASLNCCKENARFIEIGRRDIWGAEQVKITHPNVTYHVVAIDNLSINEPETVNQILQDVMQLFSEHKTSPIPETIFPLTQAIAGFKYLQQAKQIGKVVITLPPTELQFNDKASYLITGGLGGLGLQVAQYLSNHGAKKIILVGRGKPNEKIQMAIQALQNQGVEIVLKQADVSQKTAVEDLIQSLQKETHKIKGIFHLAGVIDDASLDKQTAESFVKVFAPKALGALNLHEVTQKENISLDYFVLFSSMAALNGSPGQSNYATANSLLDSLAEFRHQQGLNAVSINWGPWSEVGMAADLVQMHERQGMKPLKVDEGLAALDYILKQNFVHIGVIQADWKRASEYMAQVPSWLKELLKLKGPSVLMQQLQALPPEQREALLKEAITQEVRKVLGFSSHQPIDEMKGFFELGMDSLMALELKNRLQNLIDRTLPNTMIFDYPNINAITKGFMKLLGWEKIEESAVKQEVDKLNDTEIMQAIDTMFNKKQDDDSHE